MTSSKTAKPSPMGPKESVSKSNVYGWRQMFELIWPFVRPHQTWLIWVTIATPIGVLCQAVKPWIIQQAIDGPMSAGDVPGIFDHCLLFIGLVFFGFIFKSLGVYGLQIIGLRSLAQLRRYLFVHILDQGQRFFDERTTGSLMTRTTNDVEAISESLTRGVVGLFADALLIIATLGLMLWMNWVLTLVAFSISPFLFWVVNTCRKQLRYLFGEIRKRLSELNGLFAESIHGVSETQRYNAQEVAHQRFNGISESFMHLYHKANWWDASLYAVMDGLSALSVGLVIGYIAFQAGVPTEEGVGMAVTVGVIVAFIDALNRVYVPIREFSGRLASIQRSMAALDRILDLSNTHNEIKGGALLPNEAQVRGEIRFEDVSFRYRDEGPNILNKVSFSVSPGEVVALVGSTGSGKSTIARLLLRTYDGYEGEIYFDNQPLSELHPDFTRGQMVAVHQDPYLFKGSIAENIHLWEQDLQDDLARIHEATKRARAESFIEALPQKIDTIIAANGSDLSAGQRQLITIARAVARPCPIVILDEATASVDSLTEQWIDEATAELFEERTVLVIAHRLSTISKADRVIMIDRGEVVEVGSHEALIERGGAYAKLVHSKN